MLLFYDIECFKMMNLVGFVKEEDGSSYVFCNAKGQKPQVIDYHGTKVYINHPELSKRGLRRLDDFVGFNNHHYDDHIIVDILNGLIDEPFQKTHEIIAEHKTFRHSKAFSTLDTREQLPNNVSLKKYEAMRGLPVEESSIPFDKDDEFTLDEIMETVHYNVQDLQATKDLYKTRNDDLHGNYFDSKKLLVKEYGWGALSKNYTNGTIAASYLLGWNKLENMRPKAPVISGVSPETEMFLKRALKDSPYVTEAKTKKDREKRKAEKAPIFRYEEAMGNVFKWAWGGLHSAVGRLTKNSKGEVEAIYDPLDISDVYQLDVTSMFPNIIIRDGLLGLATDTFKNLVTERMASKKNGLPIAKAQKIVINSVYGLLRSPYSKLFNGYCAIHVNVAGMVAVYNLCLMLHNAGGRIIQTNTDGVAFQLGKMGEEEMENIRHAWEKKFKLSLELTHFKRFIQKDVNSYIAVKHDDMLKLKSIECAQAFVRDPLKASTPVIFPRMIVNYLAYGKSPLQTINESNSLLDFCYTLSSQKTKTLTGYVTDKNGKRLENKVNRAYASTDGELYLKETVNGNGSKFGSSPDKMTISNGDVRNAGKPDNLDVAFYVKIFEEKIEKWLTPDKKGVVYNM